MKEPIDAFQRLADRTPVRDVAAGALELQVGQVIQARSTARKETQRVAALRERPDHVRAQETGASSDEGLGHGQPGW